MMASVKMTDQMTGQATDRARGLCGTRGFAILALLFPILLLVGCNHFFGHDDQVKDPLTVRDQGLSCVRSVGSDINVFLDGGDRDPVKIVDCLSGALTKFADNTRGGSPDGWTRGELSSFFETYFKEESAAQQFETRASRTGEAGDESMVAPFDGDWIAQARRRAVVTELFRWKAALFGGGTTTLSRDELNRIRGLLKDSRAPLGEWRGHGKLLALRAKFSGPAADIGTLERLTKSIRTLANIFAKELVVGLPQGGGAHKSASRGREAMNLETLSSSLEQAGIKILESPDRRSLVQAIKVIVVAGDQKTIAGDEWSELVSQAGELWISALRIQYGIIQNPSAFDRDLDFVQLVAKDTAKALGRMVARHEGQISNDSIRKLISQLEINGLLPSMIKSKSVNASLEVILGKLLGGNSKLNQAELSSGLRQAHLNRLSDVIQDWAEGERVVRTLVAPTDYATIAQAKLVMSQIATKGKDQVDEAARLQMSELILRGRPLAHDAQGRLMIVPTESILGYHRSDLTNLNITRVLMSAAMQAYSHEAVRAGVMPQITEAEIQELFTDLKSIGRDLGIVDVRSLQSGIRTFMEANIFLSVSDGNQFISLHEMVEWFETVSSSGRVADLVHADLSKEAPGSPRCGTGPVDVFGKLRLKAQCFRENAVPILKSRFSHLTNFIVALERAEKAKQVPQFLRHLERATRALGESDLPIESSDVRVISPVIHYVEALFARYDLNRSGQLETPEVWSVYPSIRPFIQKLAVDGDGQPLRLSEGEERAVYSWLLEVGEPPNGSSLYGKIAFKSHHWTMWTVKEHASFEDIVKILASFQQVGRLKKNNDVVAYYTKYAKQWEEALGRGDRKTMEKTRDLFQCASEADPDLARLIQARRADIFAVNSKLDSEDQAKEFGNRLKSMIQADPQLQVLCMAF